jgi:toxin ParE1/3/4
MREVIRSPEAEADVAAALEYLDQHSATAADEMAEEIDRRCNLLAAQPLIGRSRDELRPGIRSTVVGQYVLFYRVTDAAVEVVRFLHGSRDIAGEFTG